MSARSGVDWPQPSGSLKTSCLPVTVDHTAPASVEGARPWSGQSTRSASPTRRRSRPKPSVSPRLPIRAADEIRRAGQERREPVDWAAFVTLVLAGVAADLGPIEAADRRDFDDLSVRECCGMEEVSLLPRAAG